MPPYPSPTSKWHSDTYDSISPKRPELSAKGKTVLVTGGGTGIGAATARSFAEAGASRIALIGRREQPLLETKASIEKSFSKVEVFTAPTDVANEKEVNEAFAKFAGNGKIDIVISSAALTGPLEGVANVDSEKFLAATQTNIAMALYVAKAFLRHASQDAVAVDVNSNAAHVDYGPVFASYSVAKLGIVRLWENVAAENSNLRVYHIQPGVVDTDMNKAAGGVEAMGYEDKGELRSCWRYLYRSDTDIRPVALPADFMLWLASPEGRFLKGKYLWSNWDVDELKARAQEIEGTAELSIQLVGWPFGDAGYKVSTVKDWGGSQK